MSLVMSYPSNDFSLPYLIDPTSGNPYATTDNLTAGGWLFENPFLPGQPVTLAGFGPGTGLAVGTGSGTGMEVGVGLDTGTGIASSSYAGTGAGTLTGVAGHSWNNELGDGKADYNSTMPPKNGWNGTGLMEISTEPSPLDFPYPTSASTTETAPSSAPPFPAPFYGNLQTPSSSTTADPIYGSIAVPLSQQWEVPDMIPAPLDITSFSNFPSRSIPTGPRYDQLLHAKLGSPAGNSAIAPTAPINSPLSARSYASSLVYPQPQFDAAAGQIPTPWLGTTTQMSTTATPTSLNTSQTTLTMSLSIPPTSAHPINSYATSTSTTSSPNIPTSRPVPVQQRQQPQQKLHQGIHFHPAPMSSSSGVHFYRLIDPQAQQSQGLPRGSDASGGPGGQLSSQGQQGQGQGQWNYQPTPSQPSREQTSTPTQFGEKDAGPSRASSFPFQSQPAVPPQISHSQSLPVPSQHSDSHPHLRTSPLGYYGWQQMPSADSLTPMSASSASHNPTYRTHPQPENEMHQPNFSTNYPMTYPHLHPSHMRAGVYQSWAPPTLPAASGDPRAFSSSTAPPPIDRVSAPLDSVNHSRSRSASSFQQSGTESPSFPKAEHGTDFQTEPKRAQRKRRKPQSSDGAGGSGRKSQRGNGDGEEERKPTRRQLNGQPRGQEDEKKIIIACHTCRAKKLKCDGARPRCHNCERKDEDHCSYDARLKRRGQGKKTKEKLMMSTKDVDDALGRSTSSAASITTAGRRRGPRGLAGGAAGAAGLTTKLSNREVSPDAFHTSQSASASAREPVKVEVGGS